MPHLQSVEIYLRKQFDEFTYRVKNKFEERLSATLSSQVFFVVDLIDPIDECFLMGCSYEFKDIE